MLVENMFFPVVLDEQTFGASNLEKITRASEPLPRLILFGKERRLIHSQEGRNDQVAISRRSARALSRATTDISPVARSRAETKPISLTRAAVTRARRRDKAPRAGRALRIDEMLADARKIQRVKR